MGQRNVRVVVGQGDPERSGFLRGVLEDDGFDVIGEATTTSQLARLLTDEQPDIVVLDDGIGVAAVQVATEIVPRAKLIVVWPAAVVPIAGAIRVDPKDVPTSLSATAALAAGIGVLGGIERPDWIERVRKDPATLRDLLAVRGGVPTRPSVTELQRRGHRLHPAPRSSRRSSRSKPDTAHAGEGAVVMPLSVAAAAAASTAGADDAPAERWNRRLGVIALGGAAVAGALMIALAFTNRAPDVTSAEPLGAPTVQPSIAPSNPPLGGTGGGQRPGGGGNQGGTSGGANGGANGGPSTSTPGGSAGGRSEVRGFLSGPSTRGTNGGTGTGGGTAGGGNGTSGGATTGAPGGPRSNEHLPGSHTNGSQGTGGNGGAPSDGGATAPGKSGAKNPHGGPPGWEHRGTPGGNAGSKNPHGGPPGQARHGHGR